jgi:hypothetical protein
MTLLPLSLGGATVRAPGQGWRMRISDDVAKTVVFLGFPEHHKTGTSILSIGTGFLMARDGIGYLVTAKHVAKQLDNDAFAVRMNRADGTSSVWMAEQIEWFFHPDENVDVAVTPFGGDDMFRGFDYRFVPDAWILTKAHEKHQFMGVGDVCYTIGLFRVLAGKQRNLPVVHVGNISLLPSDERVPIEDWDDNSRTRWVEAYIVQSQSLDGLSGAPVFVRPSVRAPVSDGDGPELHGVGKELYLLGLFQGAWYAPPSDIVAIGRRGPINVPVGMGIVVPADRIIEALDLPKLKQAREDTKRKDESAIRASLDSSFRADLPTTDENPTHREDFMRLVGAAVQKPKQAE